MHDKRILFLAFLLSAFSVRAQIGGETTYQFLSLTNSARIAALAGHQVAINDSSDLNLPFYNPALLKNPMSNHLLFNYVSYMAGINYGYVSFALPIGNAGMMAAGMHYINYGSFPGADEDGTITGNHFTAGEYALSLIWAGNFRGLQYGVALKPLFSAFESYRSFGLAGDAGIQWLSRNSLTSFGIVARNFGTQITTYYEGGDRESLPFEVMAGLSRKLAHAPLVFSVTVRHLNNWDLSEPEEDEISDEFVIDPEEGFGKQLMRHILVGMEVLPSRHFTLRAGYNYHLRQELKMEQRLSTVGISLGFGLKLNRFSLDYSNTRYHVAGSSNLISLCVNLNRNFTY